MVEVPLSYNEGLILVEDDRISPTTYPIPVP